MNGIACACASEVCAVMGCQRVREIRERFQRQQAVSVGDIARRAMRDSLTQPIAAPCNCIGPQNGQPLCPCQMRGLVQRNGRWVRPEQDLGPVATPGAPNGN